MSSCDANVVGPHGQGPPLEAAPKERQKPWWPQVRQRQNYITERKQQNYILVTALGIYSHSKIAKSNVINSNPRLGQ